MYEFLLHAMFNLIILQCAIGMYIYQINAQVQYVICASLIPGPTFDKGLQLRSLVYIFEKNDKMDAKIQIVNDFIISSI